MASDLSRRPITGMVVGACSEKHVSNFGVYASAERNLVFVINDFDETHPGPWEWDLKLSPRVRKIAERAIAGARAKGYIRSLDKLTEQVNGEPRIIEDVPLIVCETHSDKGTPVRDALNDMLAGLCGWHWRWPTPRPAIRR
jgi:uncharacterized protein (DUF2252 family)